MVVDRLGLPTDFVRLEHFGFCYVVAGFFASYDEPAASPTS
jgi:hypothetical protein